MVKTIVNLNQGQMTYSSYLDRIAKNTMDSRINAECGVKAIEHILSFEDGKNLYIQAVTELSKSYVIVVTHKKSPENREEGAFYQAALRTGSFIVGF